MQTSAFPHVILSWLVCVSCLLTPYSGNASELSTPEAVIRGLVQANAAKDLAAMAALMAHDPDIVSYSIGGRKYVGWEPFAREMEREFATVTRLEIPIKELKIWTRGDTAWFAMELDYIRYVDSDQGLQRTLLPLRETGVLEKRDGRWIMLGWHESSRNGLSGSTLAAEMPKNEPASDEEPVIADTLDLSGRWLIEEEDKAYQASLDHDGNGTYTHEGGSFRAISFENRRLLGTWSQTENDREGGFEVLFSEDGREARGVWWYTRVGNRNNIPARMHGGTYHWKRLPDHAVEEQTLDTATQP